VPAAAVLRLVEQNDLELVSLAGQISNVRALMDRYADTPMDFADACVVRLVEIHPDATVCTTDTSAIAMRSSVMMSSNG
jgi:hypothetical protein